MAFKVVQKGSETQVNPLGDALHSVTAILSDGSTAIAYMVPNDPDNPQDGGAVTVTVINASGTTTFTVDAIEPIGWAQDFPSIAALAGGGFVVTWESHNPAGNDYDVFAQVFTNNGGDVSGGAFMVNETTVDYQDSPTVAALPNGTFVIAWESLDAINGYDLKIKSFAADGGLDVGAILAAETLLSGAGGPDDQSFPVLTVLDSGGFIAAWETFDAGGAPTGIRYTNFIADGSPNGILVNQPVTGAAAGLTNLSITALPGDKWAAVWQADLGGEKAVFLSIVDETGTVGPAQQVNETGGQNEDPSITSLTDGGLVVTWTAGGAIYQRHYDAAGATAGPDIRVTDTVLGQTEPTVTALANGGWEVSWTAPDGLGTDVFHRSYTSDGSNVLTAGDDLAIGTDAPETLAVSSATLTAGDKLYGGGGIDVLAMTESTFTINGFPVIDGFETLAGTSGADVLTLVNGTPPVDTIDLGDGIDKIDIFTGANFANETLLSVEAIDLHDATLTVASKAHANLVRGKGAADTLILQGDIFTAQERGALYAQGIETITDDSNTFTNQASSLNSTVFSVDENTEDEFTAIAATDPEGHSVKLTITDNPGGIFELVGDEVSGYSLAVAAGKVLDFELQATYTIKIVSDDGALGTEQMVTINVTDIDEPPSGLVVTPSVSSVSEAADLTGGYEVATLNFSDDANGTNVVTLTGDDAGLFQVVGNKLMLVGPIDYETNPVLDVTINLDGVDVGDNPDDSFNFSLQVDNVNEAPTDLALTASNVDDGDVGGNFIGNVVVTDPDLPMDAFDIELTDDAGGLFTLINGSLQVAPGVTIDLDAPGSPLTYDIKVKATDKSDPSLFIEKILTLTVVPVDEAPSKPVLTNQVAIDEGAANGTVVGDLSSLDPEGAGVTLTVNSNPAFAVVGGQLVVADGSLIDYEASGGTVDVTVIAEDGTGPQSFQTFTIQLNDVNEAPTGVSIANATTSLNENVGIAGGIKVGDIVVAGDALNNAYSLTGADNDSFAIVDGANGKELWFVGDGTPPDFESQPAYDVTVIVSDSAFPGSDVSTNFTLAINDVNDPAGGAVTIDGLVGGTASQGDTLTANATALTDDEGVDTGSFTYQWFRDGSEIFGADQASYVLTQDDVDAQIHVEVSYLDEVGNPGSLASGATGDIVNVNDKPTGSATVTLDSSDEDESYTILASDLLEGFDDLDGDTLFVANVVATNGNIVENPDGNYTFTPNDDFFGTVNLTYDVTDNLGGFIPASTSFEVDPINDAPTGSPTASLNDSFEDGDRVIDSLDLLTGFADKDSASLSVTGLTADHGAITPLGGGLFLLTPELDYNGLVTLTYTVTDGAGGNVAAEQTFTLLPVNDNPTGGVTIDGIPTQGETLSANTGTLGDADGLGTFSYQWLRDGEPIVGAEGVDYVLTQDDVGALISVVVSYQDGGDTFETEPSGETSEVANVDDAPVIAGGASASYEVPEGSTAVATIMASDADGETITYSISGSDALLFAIDANGNLTFVDQPPDSENPVADADGDGVYEIVVTAKAGLLSVDQAVSVTVTPVNEFAPVIVGGNDPIPSYAENGTGIVADVDATDADFGETVEYSLTGADATLFNIDEDTGVITFKASPDFETKADADEDGVYNITVVASDGTNTDTQDIAITVTDVNEKPTDVSLSNSTVSETATVGTVVGDLSAADPDAGDTFTFSADDPNFEVVGTQLKVKAGANLDIDAVGQQRRATTSTSPSPIPAGTGLSVHEDADDHGDALSTRRRPTSASRTARSPKPPPEVLWSATSAPSIRTPATPSRSPSTIQAANSSFRATRSR